MLTPLDGARSLSGRHARIKRLTGMVFPLVLVAMAVGFLGQPVMATDWSAELHEAQKDLAKGNYAKAFAAYTEEAVQRNNPLAQFTLALFYRNGWGRSVDPAAACRWMKKAATGSIPAAEHSFGECLETGVLGAPEPAGAAIWYEKAAALGYFPSFCSLGKLYMTGQGVPKDAAKGLELCRQAAERNIPSAQVQLGLFYFKGDPAIRDMTHAYQWFLRAAEKNDPEAFYYLGIMDRDGLAGSKSLEKAKYWFESAASMGYAPAYYPTAILYLTSPVDPHTKMLSAKDLAKAYLWLSATLKRSTDREEKKKALEMLKEVCTVMPQSWVPALNSELAEHLRKYSYAAPSK